MAALIWLPLSIGLTPSLFPPLLFAPGVPSQSRATRARTYHVSVPRKVIEESKFRLVHTNQNKHNSFSLVSHVHL